MDIDQVYDVPDTPDRLATQKINGGGFVEIESDSSVACHSGKTDFLDEGARNRLRERSKLVIDNGHGRRLEFHPAKKLCTSNRSEFGGDFTISSGNSSSPKNAHLFRRKAADETANRENKSALHYQRKEKGKARCTSQSSTFRENVVDLTGKTGPAQLLQKAFPNRASEGRLTNGIRKGLISSNGISSLHGMANSSTTANYAYKGKEKMDDTCQRGSGTDRGKRICGDSLPKAGMNMAASFVSIPSPGARVQKRLVRNGCISPHITAKANQLAENHSDGSTDVQNVKGAPVSDCSSSDLSLIRELIAEDSNSQRAKGVISNLFSSKEPDANTINLSTRHSTTHHEEASGTSNANQGASGTSNANGWRSTHNRTKQINLPLSDEGQHHENSVVRGESGNGSSYRFSNNYHVVKNAVGSAPTASHVPKLDQVRGQRTAASNLIKSLKQGSASSNHSDTYTSGFVDSEVVFLGSSGEPSNSRSTSNQNSLGTSNLVIEIDEFSPDTRRGAHNRGRTHRSDSGARARQLEVDEMLARELQEQLYNEAPGVGDGEIDAHIALALQQEETSQHAFSSGSHPVFHPRGLVVSNLHRQPRTQSSQNPSIRRGTQLRGRSSSRVSRTRVPSQSIRIPRRERSSTFASDMALQRIHTLGALEAFSDMRVAGNFLPVQHEFNENDYETLLALDENNHQHGGASINQINRLPLSTVQGDNFDETCAICLDTPASGDTIRHLPCLHKFHKDCIDPWLRRRTSCPVCKCSIT